MALKLSNVGHRYVTKDKNNRDLLFFHHVLYAKMLLGHDILFGARSLLFSNDSRIYIYIYH